VWCFVSLGETATLTQGTNVTVNIDGGWPLMADLSQPSDLWNGQYGQFRGQEISIERSFMVGGGHVPGVAVTVGVICGMAMQNGTLLSFPSDVGSSGNWISSEYGLGRVAYSYEPQLVAEQ
jgi:hypothetical protein